MFVRARFTTATLVLFTTPVELKPHLVQKCGQCPVGREAEFLRARVRRGGLVSGRIMQGPSARARNRIFPLFCARLLSADRLKAGLLLLARELAFALWRRRAGGKSVFA